MANSKSEINKSQKLALAAPKLAACLRESLVWMIVATCSDNYASSVQALKRMREAIKVLEDAGVDPKIRMEGLDEIERDIARRRSYIIPPNSY